MAARAGSVLGTVGVGVTVDYIPGAVSSFELNEHRAKIDDRLPMAPPPNAQGSGRSLTGGARRAGGSGGAPPQLPSPPPPPGHPEAAGGNP